MSQLCWVRWRRLCHTLGIDLTRAAESEFSWLVSAYNEPHRTYHTAQHIAECLALLDSFATDLTANQRSILEMALWYHDSVYQPEAQDNERRSADKAVAFLQGCDVAASVIEDITALVMATCHGTSTDASGDLAPWMVDIDLAILGAAPDRFKQYEYQIRQEYGWLSAAVYGAKRRQVLTRFLQRPQLYRSGPGFDRFEHQARRNLLGLLSQPSRLDGSRIR